MARRSLSQITKCMQESLVRFGMTGLGCLLWILYSVRLGSSLFLRPYQPVGISYKFCRKNIFVRSRWYMCVSAYGNNKRPIPIPKYQCLPVPLVIWYLCCRFVNADRQLSVCFMFIGMDFGGDLELRAPFLLSELIDSAGWKSCLGLPAIKHLLFATWCSKRKDSLQPKLTAYKMRIPESGSARAGPDDVTERKLFN